MHPIVTVTAITINSTATGSTAARMIYGSVGGAAPAVEEVIPSEKSSEEGEVEPSERL